MINLCYKCKNWIYSYRPRIDAKTIKALYFAWDTSDEIEENWKSIVEGTHPDISILKKKIGRGKIKTTSPILPQQRVW